MRVVCVSLLPGLLSACVFKERVESESIEFSEPFERFTLDSDGGTVNLIGVSGSETTADVTYRYDRARPEMVWALQSDGELLVTVDCAYDDYLCEVDLDIVIPDRTVTLIDNRVGDVNVAGILLTTTLDARNGSVEATEIGGDLTIDVGVGDIVASGLAGGRVVADAEEGAITLEHEQTFEDLAANTGAGDISINVKEGRYNIVASASGGVSVAGIDADAAAASLIEANTASGDVTIVGTP